VTPEQAAHETRDAILAVGGGFMSAPETYTQGSALGFEGIDFYVAGRGGVLGDAPADVVAAAFLFFAPSVVATSWERSTAVMPRRRAAEAFAECAHTWARAHLHDEAEHTRLAALLERVVSSAPVAAAPLFAGWRLLPEPADVRALIVHRLNALRELRGALHGAAVITVGLTPLEALAVRSPHRIPVAGWTDDVPDTEPLRDRWALAEARTDRIFGRHLARLDEGERDDLVTLLKALVP
jgi:hypothetical protein